MTPDAPEGYEWEEVGAMSERLIGGKVSRMFLTEPHECGWWDGRPRGGVCRGSDPLAPRKNAWERIYVLRPVQEHEITAAVEAIRAILSRAENAASHGGTEIHPS